MSSHRRTAGFSLVEILVVIAIIGLLGTIGTTVVLNAQETGRVTKCQANLSEMGKIMGIYRTQRNKGRFPRESGIRFLLTLHRHGQVTGKNCSLFICPGTDDSHDDGGGPGSAYEDWDDIDSASISYAGRDNVEHPIRKSALEDEVIAADDNEFGRNHRNTTNYLWADGSVGAFDLQIERPDLVEQYPEYVDDGVPIGDDSPIEKFRKLRID